MTGIKEGKRAWIRVVFGGSIINYTRGEMMRCKRDIEERQRRRAERRKKRREWWRGMFPPVGQNSLIHEIERLLELHGITVTHQRYLPDKVLSVLVELENLRPLLAARKDLASCAEILTTFDNKYNYLIDDNALDKTAEALLEWGTKANRAASYREQISRIFDALTEVDSAFRVDGGSELDAIARLAERGKSLLACAETLAKIDPQYNYLIDNNALEDTASAILDWGNKQSKILEAKVDERIKELLDDHLSKVESRCVRNEVSHRESDMMGMEIRLRKAQMVELESRLEKSTEFINRHLELKHDGLVRHLRDDLAIAFNGMDKQERLIRKLERKIGSLEGKPKKKKAATKTKRKGKRHVAK